MKTSASNCGVIGFKLFNPLILFRRLCLALVLGTSLFNFSAHAAQLVVGDLAPVIVVKDQFGKELIFTNGVRYLLIAVERACATSANQQFTVAGGGFLEKHQACFVMDIHKMPAVARWFAFPKMRKYPHRVGLVDSAAMLQNFPLQANRVTVLELGSDRRIRAIKYWDPTKEPAGQLLGISSD